MDKHKELISIYTVEKGSDKENPCLIINNIANQDMRILDLIGVSNSSVYLANCAIWVEGSTDKLYLGKYLEETIKHIKEDISDGHDKKLREKLNKFKLNEGINYTFAFSAGNSIFNLDFSDDGEYDSSEKDIITRFLTNKALVITDNDDGKNPQLKLRLSEKLADKYYELQVNEIENLLSDEVVVEAVVETWSSLKKVQDITQLLKVQLEGIQVNKTTKLGSLLNTRINSKFKTKHGINQIKSFGKGTITDNKKTEFCNNAIKHITYENMSQEAKEVAMKILDFILQSNNL